MKTLTLGARTIGAGHPTYVIAEIGINHNGSVDIAKRMIKTVRAKATTMGETASNVAEKVTQVAATAAGVVVGTVQAVMPDNNESSDNTGGAA